jgi:hypothetical protein
MHRTHHQSEENRRARNNVSSNSIPRMLEINGIYYYVILGSILRLLVTANVFPSSPILVTLMIKAIRSSETSVLYQRRTV